jgi:hypothetical protein
MPSSLGNVSIWIRATLLELHTLQPLVTVVLVDEDIVYLAVR